MPEISRFFGIVVAMYYSDHPPPHFHARYGAHEIRLEINSGAILSGDFPARARRLVLDWLEKHRDELMEDWRLAGQHLPLKRINPLE